ncbi:MAG: DUF2299 family protein [Promethearchaeota archaeon]
MSEENNTQILIREYLLDEGLLRKKIKDPKIEFGFQFIFPPGKDPLGRAIGKMMVVFKPKNKDSLFIEIGTQIARIHINALDSLGEKKMQFFMDLRKSFLIKDVFFGIDIKNNRYKISDQIFLKADGTISKNIFYKSIRRVFNSAAYSNMILAEYCAGKVKPEDLTKSKDFAFGSDFSLYS